MKKEYSNAVLVCIVLLIITLPLPWVIASIFAAIVHEVGHYLVMLVLTGERAKLSINLFRATLRMPDISHKEELLCAASGPAAGMLLLLLQPIFPRLALCACVQSAFNLLPIYPLDGGRILKCLLAMVCKPARSEQICRITANLCKCIVVTGAIYAFFYYEWGCYTLIAAGIILIRENSPCKLSIL